MKTYFFSTRSMTVGYDGNPVIKEINIELEKGKILTLIGPNGAGKSTILKSITGQLELIAGAVYLEKECLSNMTEKELAKRLSIVLTERIRPELMTCKEIVETGRFPYTGRLGILSEEDKKIVNETIRIVGIEELQEKEFLKLSDGQKQRVLLARAIAQEPEILILDEPTSYLDIRYKLEFLSLLQKLAKQKHLTVIMSLHELDLAERISDQIICVKGEYIERKGTPREVFLPGYITSLYGIEEGSFDERSGMIELEKQKGSPKVFVIAGNGKGTACFRELQRKGIPFSTGILWDNDLDLPSAEALSVHVIKVPAFHNITKKDYDEAVMEIDRCDKVICVLKEFGELNTENKKLYLYACQCKKMMEEEEIWQK